MAGEEVRPHRLIFQNNITGCYCSCVLYKKDFPEGKSFLLYFQPTSLP